MPQYLAIVQAVDYSAEGHGQRLTTVIVGIGAHQTDQKAVKHAYKKWEKHLGVWHVRVCKDLGYVKAHGENCRPSDNKKAAAWLQKFFRRTRK